MPAMEASTVGRSRNLWSAEEDNLLRGLVESREKDKVDWRLIASFLPGRNNKDCRKRWHYRVSASMNLGPWSQAEDELLRVGIQRYGTHWSRVAQVVGTRNGDQCFKRWNDVLDPGINRSPWTQDEDRMLLVAIGKYGRSWKQIVDTYFPGRTGLDAKNRHRQLTRKRKREEKAGSDERDSETPARSVASVSPNRQQQAQGYISTPKYNPAASAMRLNIQKTNSLLAPRSSPHSDERFVSALSGSDWNLTPDALLPTTPYSSCSNSSFSNAGGSMSELDEYFSQHLTAASHGEQGSELLAPVSDASLNSSYPFFMPMPDGNTPGIQHNPNYMDVADTVPIRPMSSPPMSYWNPGWNVTIT
ncbi:Myb-related protein A [Talaromyces islandicus]|uniref:Myb-related protein A n=1 Tax=Talaromyces islandicus TaxID=28573 RepID=A0A0U1LZM9_TALIS|nr:Myb-related protein A [Talaromyces islandicus]